MSLYYVKRVRIPRGPERLRGLYAGARPSLFHSASPTIGVTQLPPQIPEGNADLRVARPSPAAGGGSVPLPCPFPEGNTESSTITLVPCTPPTEIPRPGGTVESSAPSPQPAERNPSVAHASSLPGGGSVSLPLPQQLQEPKIENPNSKTKMARNFPPFPPLPPVSVPFLHSCHLASWPGFLQTAPAKTVSKKCIFGAVQKSGKSTRKHRNDTAPSTLQSPVFIGRNTSSQKNPQLAISGVLAHRTKPHRPPQLRTGSLTVPKRKSMNRNPKSSALCIPPSAFKWPRNA
jgi:hypothetical protein